MRWLMVLALPVCIGAGPLPGPSLPTEIGVLSCTLGRAIDTPAASNQPAASEARELLCSFKPAKIGPEETYVGALKSINAAGPLPEKVTMLWTVRAPVGINPTVGFLQQSYAADPATPPGSNSAFGGRGKGRRLLASNGRKGRGKRVEGEARDATVHHHGNRAKAQGQRRLRRPGDMCFVARIRHRYNRFGLRTSRLSAVTARHQQLNVAKRMLCDVSGMALLSHFPPGGRRGANREGFW